MIYSPETGLATVEGISMLRGEVGREGGESQTSSHFLVWVE